MVVQRSNIGYPQAKQTNYIGRQEKKISRSPRCHTQTITHFIVGFREKKHPSHPSQPTTPLRFSCTPSAMSTKSPVASWISRESRRVTYGGGTSFEVISGRLTTQKLRHTHTHVRKAPKHFIGEKTVERSGGEHPFFCFCCFFFFGGGVGWWLNMITFCVGFSV